LQESLALIDRYLADGMSSNNLWDNRARAVMNLNRDIEFIYLEEIVSIRSKNI
jgi:hypothetical protein